jgi:hypothetical protein
MNVVFPCYDALLNAPGKDLASRLLFIYNDLLRER